MVSLEQVRALEARVEKAVALIASLKTENAQLRTGLETAESRVAELEGLVREFQQDQNRIEEGILQALRKLDQFEDVVHAATGHAKAVDTSSSLGAAGPHHSQSEVSATPESPLAAQAPSDEVFPDDEEATIAASETSSASEAADEESGSLSLDTDQLF